MVMRIKTKHVTLHAPGPRSDETTERHGVFTFQAGQRDVREYPPGSIVELDDDEATRLIARGQAERVAADAPLSAGQQGERQTLTPATVTLKDGSRLERDTEGRWRSVGHPPNSK
jgi:hypothetical protein